MKRTIKRVAALLMILSVAMTGAMAETFTFDGTVQPTTENVFFAPIGGMIASLEVREGDTVRAGDPVAVLQTTPVYASQDGTVRGLFAQLGDQAETVTERFGAVMYLEEETRYVATMSVSRAYNAEENRYVHPGEEVILRANNDAKREGTAIVSNVTDTSYTLRVLDGEFILGEKVTAYREKVANQNNLGQGSIGRTNPTAVTATGTVAAMHVANGQQVKRGDLLFEVLDGASDGLAPVGKVLTAPMDAVIGTVSVTAGTQVQKNAPVATLYPAGQMQAVVNVSENDLKVLTVGGKVQVEVNSLEDETHLYEGTVATIASTATADSVQGNAQYQVRIDFTADEAVRLGMSITVHCEG